MTADPHHHVLDIYGTHLHGATSVEQWLWELCTKANQ